MQIPFLKKKKQEVKQKILSIKRKEEVLFRIDKNPKIIQLPDIKDKTKIDITYPLIEPHAKAHIFWDTPNNELVYEILEPSLNNKEKENLALLEEGVKELINISLINIKDEDVIIEYLEKNLKILIHELKLRVTKDSFRKFMYYIYRDFVGLNEIEPMMKDYYIEDIECNGSKSPLYIVHRKYSNIRTNIVFKDNEVLASFVEKLAQKAGKYVSYANPILDGTLPDSSRVNATYTKDISSKGPTFTIRKFTKEPWTPIKLMDFRTVSPEILAYIWLLIEYEANIMIIGGTASGKTSFLNAIAFFIPPQARIVTIEDTKEINLIHENWLPSVSRAGIGLANILGQKHGEVSLFDLLRGSFRQRPDYVIVGEIRGKEAYVLFQGASSVRGNQKILLLNDDHPKRIAIKDLKNNVKYKAITIDPNGCKAKILPVKSKLVHNPRSTLYKILTNSGREVIVTSDHSVFGYDKGIIPLRAGDLKKGDKIVVPSKIPCGYADISYFNLIDEIEDIRIYAPKLIRKAVSKLGYDKCCSLCNVKAVSDYYANFTKNEPSALKAPKFLKLMRMAKINYNLDDLKVRVKYGNKIRPKLEVNKELLKLMGYYLSEGSLNNTGGNNTIQFYNKDQRVIKEIKNCIRKITGKNPRERLISRGYGESLELSFSNKIICEFINKNFGKKENKRVADFIFGLSKEKIGWFLSGLWAGDGGIDKYRFSYYTSSRSLANDVSQLLLVYNILCTIRKRRRKGRKRDDYELLFYSRREKERFLEYVRPVNKKADLSKLKKIKSKTFINDIYLDKVKSISKIKLRKKEPVYDLSIPGTQNFIGGFGGIMLHNSGHPTMSTMHAEDVETMVRRLETEPINLSPALINSLDIVCTMIQTKVQGKGVRRLKEVVEIVQVNQDKIETNTPFVRDPRDDKFYFKTDSRVFDKLREIHGLTNEEISKEFSIRTRLLMKMYTQKIFEFKEVQEVINSYYKNPETTLKKFNLI